MKCDFGGIGSGAETMLGIDAFGPGGGCTVHEFPLEESGHVAGIDIDDGDG